MDELNDQFTMQEYKEHKIIKDKSQKYLNYAALPLKHIITSGAKSVESYQRSGIGPIPIRSELVCVLEHCKNPQNLGSIVRNVDALGIDALFIITDNPHWLTYFSQIRLGRNQAIPPQCKNLHKMIRSTSKACNQWIKITAFPSCANLIQYLNHNHFTNVATSPHKTGKTNIYLNEDLPNQIKPENIAIWFGSENNGLSPMAIENAEYCIQIPMLGIVESLNLACCTAIILHYFTSVLRKKK